MQCWSARATAAVSDKALGKGRGWEKTDDEQSVGIVFGSIHIERFPVPAEQTRSGDKLSSRRGRHELGQWAIDGVLKPMGSIAAHRNAGPQNLPTGASAASPRGLRGLSMAWTRVHEAKGLRECDGPRMRPAELCLAPRLWQREHSSGRTTMDADKPGYKRAMSSSRRCHKEVRRESRERDRRRSSRRLPLELGPDRLAASLVLQCAVGRLTDSPNISNLPSPAPDCQRLRSNGQHLTAITQCPAPDLQHLRSNVQHPMSGT
ncbi:hypothetical protein CDD82_6208 [Ophiocordyceps australis]|uniref:Uncharacterized protein n=1 Tax=Ophiocordyceps australis TaxID=1399860 RepID=A0A2C5ZRC8_9HYPO|nr:hypothetical protein CDD82_6208 [Ophiocordyceps australis]